jgi:hypothetical protein
LLDDSMSMERLRQALQRDFYLHLSDGALYDCLDWKVRQVEMPAYRHWSLENFSGTLCIDEIHLGHRTLLLATDPVNDFPVAFALVRANDQDHMRCFLNKLKNWGFAPKVVEPALQIQVVPGRINGSHRQHRRVGPERTREPAIEKEFYPLSISRASVRLYLEPGFSRLRSRQLGSIQIRKE